VRRDVDRGDGRAYLVHALAKRLVARPFLAVVERELGGRGGVAAVRVLRRGRDRSGGQRERGGDRRGE
jgi:hypothetical protein